jgi:hypothetical protein
MWWRQWHRVGLAVLVFMVTALAGWVSQPSASGQGDESYPDLRTAPAQDLLLDVEQIGDQPHHVLRFSTEIWNMGEGPLELRGDSSSGITLVSQRIHRQGGAFSDFLVGQFVFHEAHGHWHFEGFALHELWTRASFDAWLASRRTEGRPEWQGSKTTGQGESFCLRDSWPSPRYTGPLAAPRFFECGESQGISVGWADVYTRDMPDQWVDIGLSQLPNGDYVLRLVADPWDRIHESRERANPQRESQLANEALTEFAVFEGRIVRQAVR